MSAKDVTIRTVQCVHHYGYTYRSRTSNFHFCTGNVRIVLVVRYTTPTDVHTTGSLSQTQNAGEVVVAQAVRTIKIAHQS
jgi:hypothetical protein